MFNEIKIDGIKINPSKVTALHIEGGDDNCYIEYVRENSKDKLHTMRMTFSFGEIDELVFSH